MPVGRTKAPAYNVQTAVDAEHALIVAHAVTLDAGDNRQLEPMAQAAKAVLETDSFHVVADAGVLPTASTGGAMRSRRVVAACADDAGGQ